MSPFTIPDVSLHPYTQYPCTHDLRLAINLLEFGLDTGSSTEARDDRDASRLSWGTVSSSDTLLEPRQELSQLVHLQRHTDNISYTDVYVTRSDDTAEEVSSPAAQATDAHLSQVVETDLAPSSSEELGYLTLRDVTVLGDWPHAISSSYDQDRKIARHLAELSLGRLEDRSLCHVSRAFSEALDSFTTFRARADYQLPLVAVLGPLLSISAPLLPRPAALVDYEAWIRIMIRIDDALEALARDGQLLSSRGRTTRNSASTYVRLISVSEEHRDFLAATTLKCE
jgi:hypothetical protein